jgi:hypothetical protein
LITPSNTGHVSNEDHDSNFNNSINISKENNELNNLISCTVVGPIVEESISFKYRVYGILYKFADRFVILLVPNRQKLIHLFHK